MIARATVRPPTPLSKIPILASGTLQSVGDLRSLHCVRMLTARVSPAPHPCDLTRLGDQAALRVPHLGVLVEPALGDEPAARDDGEPAGGGHGAHVPGELDGRRPA